MNKSIVRYAYNERDSHQDEILKLDLDFIYLLESAY